MFTAITENNHQLHCSGFERTIQCVNRFVSINMDLANLATLLFISGNVHPYPRAPSATTLTPGTLAPSAIWMWAEILFNALLASSGCISFAAFLPVLTFAQSVPLALQWAGDASVPSPKENWLPHSDQSPCCAACVPFLGFPLLPPGFYHSRPPRGPPTLPLLHLLSRGR